MASSSPRAIFMAFGTKGDVFPIAAIASAFASDQSNYNSLDSHLAEKDSEMQSFSMRKKTIQMQHRQECLSTIERIFGDGPSVEGDFIVINFFALEGWSLAELYQVRCVVAAPYVVPYSAPSSFERQFRHEFPVLYKYFQEAPANKLERCSPLDVATLFRRLGAMET